RWTGCVAAATSAMRSARPVLLALWLLLAAGAAVPGWTAEDRPDGADDPFAEFDPEEWDDPWATRAGGLRWTGFVEGAGGARWTDVDNLDRLTLGELRLRIETGYAWRAFQFDFKGDVVLDGVVEEPDAELRELAASFRPAERVDVKLGRQVLTWGTGDLLFL